MGDKIQRIKKGKDRKIEKYYFLSNRDAVSMKNNSTNI